MIVYNLRESNPIKPYDFGTLDLSPSLPYVIMSTCRSVLRLVILLTKWRRLIVVYINVSYALHVQCV